MPSQAQIYRLEKHQRPDFQRTDGESFEVACAQPKTRVEIRDYLEDIGASALATANQFVDPETATECYEDMAMRVHEDVTSGLYPLDVAILRQQYRELGFKCFGYAVVLDSDEEIVRAG
jgi:hypothetical protein